MKTPLVMLVGALLLAASSTQAAVTKAQILAHAKKHNLSDNRSNLKKEPHYGAWSKGFSEPGPRLRINGYWRKKDHDFKQLDLLCEQCQTGDEITEELVSYCRDRLKEMYAGLFSAETPGGLEKSLSTLAAAQTIQLPVGKAKVSEVFLKCDGLGGRGIKISIFPALK